jgi:hypothetical protein
MSGATSNPPRPREAATRRWLRSGDEVMTLPRLGCLHPSRLSFTRSLVRRMHREGWRIERGLWDLDGGGHGTVVYRIHGAGAPLSFVAFTREIDPQQRTDRVIATRWDAAFALVCGEPDAERLQALRAAVPLQEAGRMGEQDLVLSRANKSLRLFEHVTDCLARGRQPEPAALNGVGYLMRTTAVYGNGKFGLQDLPALQRSGPFELPFQAEMLTVYLARELSVDLVEHVARSRAPDTAVSLDRSLRRGLGVGNATGLGMAPFLVNHPGLLHAWMGTREHALARVKALRGATSAQIRRYRELLARARQHVAQWHTDDRRQQERIDGLARDLAWLQAQDAQLVSLLRDVPHPFAALCERVRDRCSMETQELLHSLLLELAPELVDELEQWMGAAEALSVDPAMPVARLRALVEARYAFALTVDFDDPEAMAQFWYVSQEKAEPRLGERGVDAGDELETRIDIARQVHALHATLRRFEAAAPSARVAELLLRSPELRGIIARVQSLAALDYAEIRGNLVGRECLPIDMLRAKLATFGAGKFDPKSDRWTRITLFQGAPVAAELHREDADDWWLPVVVEDPACPSSDNG